MPTSPPETISQLGPSNIWLDDHRIWQIALSVFCVDRLGLLTLQTAAYGATRHKRCGRSMSAPPG
jgi:hypothetical protein